MFTKATRIDNNKIFAVMGIYLGYGSCGFFAGVSLAPGVKCGRYIPSEGMRDFTVKKL